MKKLCLLLFVFISLGHILFAQEDRHFANELILGASFTYLRFADDDFEYRYHEMTSNINLSTHIAKNVYLGLGYMNIRSISKSLVLEKEKNGYFMVGVFVQYDFLPQQKNRLMAEISYHYGNYCTCGKSNPYRPYESSNLSYFGFGGSYDWHLVKGLFLDIGFNVYTIINKREKKDIFTQYVVGLNYHFNL